MLSKSLRVLSLVITALPAIWSEARAAAANSLANVSTRGQVGTGENALHVSFTVEGNSPKSVLVRGLGPALATFGVPGTLANPVVTVHDGSGAVVASNDDWGGTPALSTAFANAGAFALSAASRDAALLVTLVPGTYTVRVTGAGGTTGTALAEVYENDDVPRYVYQSVKHHVGSGSNALLAGFVITGPSSQSVLVRALGPAIGSSGALANPTLTLFGSNGASIGQNDNWSGADVANAAAAAGLMPLTPGSQDSALLVTLPPGAYTAQVSGVGGTTGLGACEIALVNGRAASLTPALIAVPDNVSVSAGSSLTLAAPFVGNPTPTLQWRKNGAAIAGATSSRFTLASVDAASVGSYSVVLSSSAGSVTSQPWVVTTTGGTLPPAITAQPLNADVQLGDSAVFSVSASGTGPLVFQWNKDGVPIPNQTTPVYAVQQGANSSTLTVINTNAQSAGIYRVTVSNSAGAVVSRDATLTVSPARTAPTFVNQPSDILVTVGDSAQLQAIAAGNPAPTYQWFKDGALLIGATSPSYTIANARTADAGGYFVVVTNTVGTLMSRTAALTVSTTPLAPSIATQPATVAVVRGTPAQFAVAATGTSPLRYQWHKNGTPIPNQTNPTLSIPATTFDDVGTYTVVVSNNVGSVSSNPVSLSLIGRYGAAAYFGSLGAGGTFALFVTDANTGYFLGQHAASRTTIVNRSITVASDGSF